ncbi:hypothetical protein GUJ93_ZPchr0006g40612 [Zizania palustris]|uniref:Uncharacterized protein n=1 Tax=Zizania palustris TaxID=103762 RepID=A0A8J5T208_ZIZPA|nr:hypothetical protein GUJ93_ZPchr0006g40612 [Zizania palustris]
MTRPVTPVIAAKFATECNIAVRNHVHILKNGSEYKKKPTLFDLFLARIRNVGIRNVQPRSSELTDLKVDKRTNAELQLIINAKHAKMDELQRQLEETEAARVRDKEEMKKQQVEMNVKIELLLRRGKLG